MLGKKILSIILTFVVGHVAQVTAEENLHLHHINTKGYAVRVIHRDASGIMWLGTTSGLLSLSQLESRNPSGYHRNLGSANMSIKRINGDREGGLWIKTIYNDNYYYNPLGNLFREDTSNDLAARGVNISSEFTVTTDTCSNLWIWKDNRIYRLKGNEPKAEMISLSADNQIWTVLPGEDALWALSQKSLYRIDPDRKQITMTMPLPEERNVRDHLWVSRSGRPWVWAADKVWRKADDRWEMMIKTPSDITAMAGDDEGRIWMASQSDGIFVCDSTGTLITNLRHSPGDAHSLLSNNVETVTYDTTEHLMWIAYTKGGLSVFSKNSNGIMLHDIAELTMKNDATDVLNFARAKAGSSMWIGLEKNGVWLHDRNGDRKVIGEGSAVGLYATDSGDLWAGLYRHGLVHRTTDGRQRLYMEGMSPFAIAEDEHGSIYAALLGKGVWQLDPASGEVTDTGLEPKFAFGLEYYQHKLYAATTEGLYVMDGHKEWRLLCHGHFHYLNIDQHGYIWLLGNEGCEGLTLLDADGNLMDLPEDLKKAPLKSIAIDKEGNVWTTTTSELIMLRFDPNDSRHLQRFSFNVNRETEQVFYNPQKTFVDDNGILWLGTTQGYQGIDTRRLMAKTGGNMPARRPELCAVSVNDNILSPGEPFNGRFVLDKEVNFISELDLRYNENNIVIECRRAFYDTYTGDTYFYNLEGLSDVWHPMEGNTITLSNLPPGSYRLMIRTQSSEAHRLITIRVAPPFWLSWWAFCIYALFALGIIYGVMRYRRNRRDYQQKMRTLELQKEQQTQMNELKLRFFTNISHDIRTPLSLIIGPVEELLQSDNIDRKVLKTSLNLVHRNAQHLMTLVNQILDFRRLEFGKEKLTLSYGDIVTLLTDVCESFRLKAEKEQIRFCFIPNVERVETMFDSDKTTKIMMNLLSNAFKFTDAGGSITVRLDIANNQIIISVADTGIGIADTDKEHLFDRFYQSDQSNRTLMGSGIGLHIAREYVKLQGGEISVEDNQAEAKGSIFSFSLPLKKNEVLQKEAAASQETPAPDEGEDRSNESVEETDDRHTLLLVDDNQDLLCYMSQSLCNDYRILTAANGEEALQVLAEKDADLIISDVMMNKMDGLELCRKVKGDIETSHIPVVLLTAKSMSGDELKGLEAGADDYVTKPFSMEILRQRIHNLIERSLRQHELFANEMDIKPSEITVTSLDEQFIANAIAIVEKHIAEPDFSIEQLSDEIGVHRTQLYKKLQHITGKSPQQFVRLLRLKRGKQLLSQSGLYVSEVAYQVGFNSPRIFSKYFKEEFGITPKDFVNQE